MSYSTQDEALAVGKELCPEGWSFRVWDNIGWHVCWRKGPISVYEGVDYTFHALIAPYPDECESGGEWTSSSHAASILEAAAAEIAVFRKYVQAQQQRWQEIEDKLAKIEEGFV